MKMPPGEIVAVLADLTILGVSVRVTGDQLRLRPRSKVTPEMLHRVSRHKAELLEVIRQEVTPVSCLSVSALPRERFQRFIAAQQRLRERGFRVLADKPEVVLALLETAESLLPKSGDTDHE